MATKQKKAVDLRTIKKHKLYPELNELFTEFFLFHPAWIRIIIPEFDELLKFLRAKHQKQFSEKDLRNALEAYGDELPDNGGWCIKRSDFIIPCNL